MNDTVIKLESLEKNIETQLKKSKRGIYLVVIVYVILIAFVFAYTSFIIRELKVLAEPPVVAEFIVEQVQARIPLVTDNLKRNSNAYADAIAGSTITYIRSSIPLIGDLAKGQIDKATDMINIQMNEQYLPIIEEYFKMNKVQITDIFNQLIDDQIALQMNNILFERLDSEAKLFNEPLTESINDLEAKILKLASTPNSQLTNKELAQKKIIAYWIFLINYQKLTGFSSLGVVN